MIVVGGFGVDGDGRCGGLTSVLSVPCDGENGGRVKDFIGATWRQNMAVSLDKILSVRRTKDSIS